MKLNQFPQPGPNRTTIVENREQVQAMVEGIERFPPNSEGSARDIARVRIDYAQKDHHTIGSVPAAGPNGRAGMILLADKLGERIGFESMGVRLYEGLIAKHEAYGSFEGGPGIDDLRRIRGEELDHLQIATQALEQLGGDPCAVTPSASLAGTAGMGLSSVIADPRTTLVQCLEAILIAELTDNDGWDSLVAIARGVGQDEMAENLTRAAREEEGHLGDVRTWLAAAYSRAGS